MALLSKLLLLASPAVVAAVSIVHTPVGTAPPLPLGTPHPPPDYMKDNSDNYWGTAPDKGTLEAPVLAPLNATTLGTIHGEEYSMEKRQNSDDYWLSSLGGLGKSPFAPDGYQFFRNVRDFGAVGDGVTDDTAAINRAAAAFSAGNTDDLRCGKDCGSTTTLSAVVYFPPGTYLVSTPIIQYYHSQFVGDPNNKPVIKGSANFTGIALFDSDVYIPGGDGAEWYINQSNFYRQIRNFVFDMTGQDWENYDNDQRYVPTGIHWQVGQATSITNCDFKMAVSVEGQSATGVGIYMENGSGGFVSDLTFVGGNIGFLAGSQQFTANNLKFTSCLTAIYSQWNWGFTWKNIYVLSCYIALDCTSFSGATSQGTGSITVLDSHFNGVPYAITVQKQGDDQPNIVLDNLLVENSQSVILVSGGETVLAGSAGPLYFNSWGEGYQVRPNGQSGKQTGFINPAPTKPDSLLDASGAYFTRPKPQYESVGAGSIVVATNHGISNDGSGDQTAAINSLLRSSVGSVVFFPGGVYMVQGTVKVPVGSRIVGSGWSQIMATGSYFADEEKPQVVVQVGETGDSGVIEISDMLFTVKGATAGAVLMEWNVHESTQGSAAMWDSHFRVGGAAGTDLQLADCPLRTAGASCMAASMLLHVRREASGYFENMWAWVADHDLDNDLNALATEGPDGIPKNVQTQISVYAGRGILIESQGPTWLYGSAAEHTQLYQYQLSQAANVFLGHMQTETPYYQPNPVATQPFTVGRWESDPTFDDCRTDQCRSAWALRVVDSRDVFVYSAGFYSFFQDNELGCTDRETCQLRMVQTDHSERLWIYNLFTKGNVQIVSPAGSLPPLLFNDTTKNGYTSEIAAWLRLATGGSAIGSGDGGGNVVYIDPDVYPPQYGGSGDPDGAIVGCEPPCTYVLPPVTLPEPSTISFPGYTTSLEVGCFANDVYTGLDHVGTTVTGFVSVTVTTVLTYPPVTVSVIPVSNVPIVDGVDDLVIYPELSLVGPVYTITEDHQALSDAGYFCLTDKPVPRAITPKPWPWKTYPTGNITTTQPSTSTQHSITLTHTTSPVGPTCSAGCGSTCEHHCSSPCRSGCNTDGQACTTRGCVQGGDCAGPSCTAGGDCEGDTCTRGGDCTGPKCRHSGGCTGPHCHRGGSCFGPLCDFGGGCVGPLCDHGGGCGPFGCPPGPCVGPQCVTNGNDDDPEDDPDFPDPEDPNDPEDDPDDECTTTTTTSCRTQCYADSTTDCATKSTSCRDVIGCDATATDEYGTATPAPAYGMPLVDTWVTEDTGQDYEASAGASIVGWLSSIGDFDSMTTRSGSGSGTGTGTIVTSVSTVVVPSTTVTVTVVTPVDPPPTPDPTPESGFWMVSSYTAAGVGGDDYQDFLFFSHLPDCDDAGNAQLWTPMDDLSHSSNSGVRCVGCGGGLEVGQASVVEVRSTTKFHWTWYADREGAVVDAVTGAVLGSCAVNHDITLDCFVVGNLGKQSGRSEIYCTGFDMPGR